MTTLLANGSVSSNTTNHEVPVPVQGPVYPITQNTELDTCLAPQPRSSFLGALKSFVLKTRPTLHQPETVLAEDHGFIQLCRLPEAADYLIPLKKTYFNSEPVFRQIFNASLDESEFLLGGLINKFVELGYSRPKIISYTIDAENAEAQLSKQMLETLYDLTLLGKAGVIAQINFINTEKIGSEIIAKTWANIAQTWQERCSHSSLLKGLKVLLLNLPELTQAPAGEPYLNLPKLVSEESRLAFMKQLPDVKLELIKPLCQQGINSRAELVYLYKLMAKS